MKHDRGHRPPVYLPALATTATKGASPMVVSR